MGNVSKKSFLFGAVACLTLAVSCIIAVNSSNTDNEVKADNVPPVLSIAAKNLNYGEKVDILYYVYSDGVDKNDIKMLFWDTPQAEYVLENTPDYIVTEKIETVTIEGTEYDLYASRGLAPKEFNDYIYCRACVDVNGETFYSKPQKYSVVDYVYNRRASGDVTTVQDNAYTALLNYGSAIQELLDYNTGALANAQHYKIKVRNGVLADGFTFGRYVLGESLTLSADLPEDGMEFYRWVNSTGDLVSEEAEFVFNVTGEETFTAEYREAHVHNYEAVVTPPTATLQGYTTYTCACGDSYVDDYVDALGILQFTLNDEGSGYIVSGVASKDITEVVIPSMHQGLPVTAIGAAVFANCGNLQSIVIPESVTQIGTSAFYNCSNLEKIYYGGSDSMGWNYITINDRNAPLVNQAIVYYYYEQDPKISGEYWHFVDGVPVIWE